MTKTESNTRANRIPPLLMVVVLSLLLLLAIASLGSYRDLRAARDRQELLELRIEQARQRNAQLALDIERLHNDPTALERLAREQYRMMRPGDVVIILPEESEPGPTPEAAPLP